MFQRAYLKNVLRTIKGSVGRYLILVGIIALGIGLYSGYSGTGSDMIKTAEYYFQKTELQDACIISSLGLTDDSVEQIQDSPDVKDAEGCVFQDFYSTDKQGNRIVLRAHSIPQKINRICLTEGRLPAGNGECVGDDCWFSEKDIGSYVTLKQENGNTDGRILKKSRFKLVGLVSSPLYISTFHRGTTSLGNGTIKSYVYLNRDAFNSDCYTGVCVTSAEKHPLYSEDYENSLINIPKQLEPVAKRCNESRYREIKSKLSSRLNKRKAELEENRTKIENQKKAVYSALKENKKKLDKANKKLTHAENNIPAKKKKWEETSAQISAVMGILEERQQSLTEELQAEKEKLAEAEEKQDQEAIEECSRNITDLQEKSQKIDTLYTAIESKLSDIKKQQSEIREKLSAKRKKIEKGYQDYRNYKNKADVEFAKADARIDKAEGEIQKLENRIGKLKRGKATVLNRESNPGYGAYKSSAEAVGNLALVFPLFFFFVTVMLCSNAITRMIEEERKQVGILSALGMTKRRISLKYLFYTGSATVFGCALGLLLGYRVFPDAIFYCYHDLFKFSKLCEIFDWKTTVLSVICATICTIGTTEYCCHKHLNVMTAEIMRPKAPSRYQAVWLDNIGGLWNRMDFMGKAAVRNIFRYKKRFALILVGIAGCTALILGSLGVRDSLEGIASIQFGEVETYDIVMQSSKDIEGDYLEELKAQLNGNDIVGTCNTAITATDGNVTVKCSMIAANETDALEKMIHFGRTEKRSESVSRYAGPGECIISSRMSELLNIQTGDTIHISDGETQADLSVARIYRNYYYNYVIMGKSTYEDSFRTDFSPDNAYVKISDKAEIEEYAKKLNKVNGVAGVTIKGESEKTIEQSLDSLTSVVGLMIGCALVLTLILLYNSCSQSIRERRQEIMILNSLGLSRGKIRKYLFEENILAALAGIAVGIPIGKILHGVIMERMSMHMFSFPIVIHVSSYITTVLTVLAFLLAVECVMSLHLKKLDPARFLKEVE